MQGACFWVAGTRVSVSWLTMTLARQRLIFFFTSNRCTITSLKGSFGYMSSQNEWNVNVIRPRDAEGRGEYSCYILKRYYKLYNKQTGKPFTFTAESHPTPRLRRTHEKNTLIFSTYYILLINHMSLVHRDKQH